MTETQTVELDQGTIRYRETRRRASRSSSSTASSSTAASGTASPRRSRGDFRCIQPDLPMGSHRSPMKPDADLSPPGMARIIADFLEALDLENVTIVGNDSGGAMSQVLVTDHPERIARLVLTNCDSLRALPAGLFKAMPPHGAGPRRARAMRSRCASASRHGATAYGPFTKTAFPDELLESWARAGPRRDRWRSAATRATVTRHEQALHARGGRALRELEHPGTARLGPRRRLLQAGPRRAAREGDPGRAPGVRSTTRRRSSRSTSPRRSRKRSPRSCARRPRRPRRPRPAQPSCSGRPAAEPVDPATAPSPAGPARRSPASPRRRRWPPPGARPPSRRRCPSRAARA